MAGSIVFNGDSGVSMSTFQIKRFAGLLRDEFHSYEKDVLLLVFDPFDNAALNYLDAFDLTVEQYHSLCNVIKRAHFRSVSNGHPLIPAGLWGEILEAMTRDSRYSPDSSDASRAS